MYIVIHNIHTPMAECTEQLCSSKFCCQHGLVRHTQAHPAGVHGCELGTGWFHPMNCLTSLEATILSSDNNIYIHIYMYIYIYIMNIQVYMKHVKWILLVYSCLSYIHTNLHATCILTNMSAVRNYVINIYIQDLVKKCRN